MKMWMLDMKRQLAKGPLVFDNPKGALLQRLLRMRRRGEARVTAQMVDKTTYRFTVVNPT